MKIDKAIELLERWQNGNDITSFEDVNTATKLGIEALKRLQDNRNSPIPPKRLLPSEKEQINFSRE